ncbi:MAG: leucine-rich repeat protein, partial [Clostridia bacterium]|nr:leucine-rich repeat protein [Clostridia bacterium]
MVNVIVVDSEYFSLIDENGEGVKENSFAVEKGGEVKFTLKLLEGFAVGKVHYKEYDLSYISPTEASLVISNIRQAVRIQIDCVPVSGFLKYDVNGGNLISGDSEYFYLPYDNTHHIRVNTSIGTDVIERVGYTQIGWNTKADGNGEHVGLGSRVSLNEETQTLYAEWQKWTETTKFVYTEIPLGISLTGYEGNDEVVCIPEEINGKKVANIAAGCFKNISATTMILPKSLVSISDFAFENCALTTLYFFDNITTISDACFTNCANFSTLCINAVKAPRYSDLDRHANTPDKYDILIENAHKKKIVIFGGSGPFLSVDTRVIQEAYPAYMVINMAVNAYFNVESQIDMILPYLNEGDLFIHVTESASKEQFFDLFEMSDNRIFMAVESNYDLFSHVDISTIGNVFDTFNAYNTERDGKFAKTYNDYVEFIDELGNYALKKVATGNNVALSDEAVLNLDSLTSETGIARRDLYYKKIEAKGVSVLLCNAPVNRHALLENNENYMESVKLFDEQYAKVSSRPILMTLEECLYDGSVMFDSDYHLADEATK